MATNPADNEQGPRHTEFDAFVHGSGAMGAVASDLRALAPTASRALPRPTTSGRFDHRTTPGLLPQSAHWGLRAPPRRVIPALLIVELQAPAVAAFGPRSGPSPPQPLQKQGIAHRPPGRQHRAADGIVRPGKRSHPARQRLGWEGRFSAAGVDLAA